MISKRLSRRMSIGQSSLAWSNVDYQIGDFTKHFALPQVVRVKRDATKSSCLKANTELVLHESVAAKKLEAVVVSENRKFVIPYDCPAKVYQLTKAEEYRTLGELRKAVPTCRFILVTKSLKGSGLSDIQPGQVLTIVVKRNINGEDVFTCKRKKFVEIQVPSSTVGGFAPMATTQERRINEFVRHYSTFPVGIGLGESTLCNKSLKDLTDFLSNAQSLLIRLTKLSEENTIVASSLGRKKTMYYIPVGQELTVTAPKALLLENLEHSRFCKEMHDAVDMGAVRQHLNLAITAEVDNALLQWSYGEEAKYVEATVDDIKDASKQAKQDKTNTKAQSKDDLAEPQEVEVREARAKEIELEKEKAAEKERAKAKEKEERKKEKNKAKLDKEKARKEKEKLKEEERKKAKEKAREKAKEKAEKAKAKSKEKESTKGNDAGSAELLEDDAGYLVPAELVPDEQPKPEVKTLEGEYEIAESSAEKSPAPFGLSRLKGKGKKKDRPASELVISSRDDLKTKSASLPMNSNNRLAVNQKKSKTLSTIDVDTSGDGYDEVDAASVSPTDKKGGKNFFSTAGKKTGALFRKKLAISKVIDDEVVPKDTSTTPAVSHDDNGADEQLSVASPHTPLSLTSSDPVHRPLPCKPPGELAREISSAADPYTYDNEDDDELYDEIMPVPDPNYKIPKDLAKLNVEGVCDLLRYLNMGEHVSKFRRDQIDGHMFKSLNEQLLGALGVADPIQIHKVRQLIKGWRPKNN